MYIINLVSQKATFPFLLLTLLLLNTIPQNKIEQKKVGTILHFLVFKYSSKTLFKIILLI